MIISLNKKKCFSLAQVLVGLAVLALVLIPVSKFISSFSKSTKAVGTREKVLTNLHNLAEELMTIKHNDYIKFLIKKRNVNSESKYSSKIDISAEKDFFPVTYEIIEESKDSSNNSKYIPEFNYKIEIIPKAGLIESKKNEVSKIFPELTSEFIITMNWLDKTKTPAKKMKIIHKFFLSGKESPWGTN